MAMFGSSWNEDSIEIGPFSHWLEDEDQEEIEEVDINVFSHWKDDDEEE